MDLHTLGESDNQISVLSFLSHFYMHVKTGIYLKHLISFLDLSHYFIQWSKCSRKFVTLVLLFLWKFFPIKYYRLFFPSIQHYKRQKRKQLHFKNMKIFIHLDTGPCLRLTEQNLVEKGAPRIQRPHCLAVPTELWADKAEGGPERMIPIVWFQTLLSMIGTAAPLIFSDANHLHSHHTF